MKVKETLHLFQVTLGIAVPEGIDPEAFVADWANETLREMQRAFTPDSALLDYAFGELRQSPTPVEGYTEGEM